MDAVVTGLNHSHNMIFVFVYLFVYVFVFVLTCMDLYFYVVKLVFGFCTMSGVCDGCSGDWVIGLSNHINEAAQEEGRSSKVFMGALSQLSKLASSFPSLSSEICSSKAP